MTVSHKSIEGTDVIKIQPPQNWRNSTDYCKTVLTHPWYKHIAKIQHSIHICLHNFFTEKGLITVSMPITTFSISSPMGLGSDSLPVEVDLFDVKTYLADSMQFMLELGLRLHGSGVYYIMPCFRGEKTDQYHLPQFYHVEAEIAGTLADVMQLVSSMLHYLSVELLQQCADTIISLAGTTRHIEQLIDLKACFPQISMDDALHLLGTDSKWVQQHPAGFKVLTKAGEEELTRRHNGQPVWLTHFDHLAVPFYQAYEDGTDKALNADLILGTCETVGAGQRHLTSVQVRKALTHHQVATEPYAWYLDMRDQICLQTSGFGMGLERYLLWLLQHNDIRDIPLLYRENGVVTIP